MRPASTADRAFAPAKINLALHVVGRRSDGYHLLESLVVFASDLGDDVAIGPATALSNTTISGPFATALGHTPPGQNLARRAADALAAGHAVPTVGLDVTKRIPVASGLGGGSADAAATLRLLDRRWGLDLGSDRLAAIGATLGADVPMCLQSRPLVARGVGEQITPVAGTPALHLVLACPPVAVKTADVFRALRDPDRAPLPPVPGFTDAGAVAAWLAGSRNDLAEPAASVSPMAAAAAEALARDPACLFSRMTGSGPAAYGLFAERADADRSAARLAQTQPGWWVAAVTTGAS